MHLQKSTFVYLREAERKRHALWRTDGYKNEERGCPDRKGEQDARGPNIEGE
jgi:hypothetical protein